MPKIKICIRVLVLIELRGKLQNGDIKVYQRCFLMLQLIKNRNGILQTVAKMHEANYLNKHIFVIFI